MALLNYGDNVIIAKKGTVFVYSHRTGKRLSPAEEVAAVTNMFKTLLEKDREYLLRQVVDTLGVENVKNLFRRSFKGFIDGLYLKRKILAVMRDPLDFSQDFVEKVGQVLGQVVNTYTDYKDRVSFSPNLLNVVWEGLASFGSIIEITTLCYGAALFNLNPRTPVEEKLPYWGYIFEQESPADFAFAFKKLKNDIESGLRFYPQYAALRYAIENGLYDEKGRELMLNILTSELNVTPKLVEKPKLAEFFNSLSEEDLKDDFFFEKYGEQVARYLTLDFSPSPANELDYDQVGPEV